jgi:endonuclease YncB( thermonuclease family)
VAALRDWWRQRSRKAKAALASLAVLVALVALGALSDSDGDKKQVRAATQPETVTLTVEKPPSPPPPRTPTLRGFIVSEVVDGDTINLANGRRVRLVQIDAPELSGRECYANLSRTALQHLLADGSRVRLEFDPRLDRVDRYGRQLAYVFVGRKNVNLAMVRRGAASVWFFNGERGKYADRLLLAARQARAASRGLWRDCSATQLDPLHAVSARKPPPPPPPPPPPSPESPPPKAVSNCHPSYEGACLNPDASDYDCAGGSGNGPEYTGYVTVVGYDEYGLDADGDGGGCEDG